MANCNEEVQNRSRPKKRYENVVGSIYLKVMNNLLEQLKDEFSVNDYDEVLMKQLCDKWYEKVKASNAVEVFLEPECKFGGEWMDGECTPVVARRDNGIENNALSCNIHLTGGVRETKPVISSNGNIVHIPNNIKAQTLINHSNCMCKCKYNKNSSSVVEKTLARKYHWSYPSEVYKLKPDSMVSITLEIPSFNNKGVPTKRKLPVYVPAEFVQNSRLDDLLNDDLVEHMKLVNASVASAVLRRHVHEYVLSCRKQAKDQHFNLDQQLDGIPLIQFSDDTDSESNENISDFELCKLFAYKKSFKINNDGVTSFKRRRSDSSRSNSSEDCSIGIISEESDSEEDSNESSIRMNLSCEEKPRLPSIMTNIPKRFKSLKQYSSTRSTSENFFENILKADFIESKYGVDGNKNEMENKSASGIRIQRNNKSKSFVPEFDESTTETDSEIEAESSSESKSELESEYESESDSVSELDTNMEETRFNINHIENNQVSNETEWNCEVSESESKEQMESESSESSDNNESESKEEMESESSESSESSDNNESESKEEMESESSESSDNNESESKEEMESESSDEEDCETDVDFETDYDSDVNRSSSISSEKSTSIISDNKDQFDTEENIDFENGKISSSASNDSESDKDSSSVSNDSVNDKNLENASEVRSKVDAEVSVYESSESEQSSKYGSDDEYDVLTKGMDLNRIVTEEEIKTNLINPEYQIQQIKDEESNFMILNSDDDITSSDSNDETDNICVCVYEKVRRYKNKYHMLLKYGIMNIAGEDYVFKRANVTGTW